jgi:hypothetical protein
MKPKHPCSVKRDAIFLAAVKHPFTRWNEHTGEQQARFIKQATHIREHLRDYEPGAFID